MNHTSNGVLISGDAEIIEKSQKGNGNIPPELLSVMDVNVDAHNLSILYDKAAFTGPLYDNEGELLGYPHAKRYVQLKAKFIEQQQLSRESFNASKPSNEPAITSQSIKPVSE